MITLRGLGRGFARGVLVALGLGRWAAPPSPVDFTEVNQWVFVTQQLLAMVTVAERNEFVVVQNPLTTVLVEKIDTMFEVQGFNQITVVRRAIA